MSSTSAVLLTGSRGFTGRYVREALVQTGYQVTGLVQDTPGPGEVHGDISDPASLREAISKVRPHFVIQEEPSTAFKLALSKLSQVVALWIRNQKQRIMLRDTTARYNGALHIAIVRHNRHMRHTTVDYPVTARLH